MAEAVFAKRQLWADYTQTALEAFDMANRRELVLELRADGFSAIGGDSIIVTFEEASVREDDAFAPSALSSVTLSETKGYLPIRYSSSARFLRLHLDVTVASPGGINFEALLATNSQPAVGRLPSADAQLDILPKQQLRAEFTQSREQAVAVSGYREGLLQLWADGIPGAGESVEVEVWEALTNQDSEYRLSDNSPLVQTTDGVIQQSISTPLPYIRLRVVPTLSSSLAANVRCELFLRAEG